MDKIEVGMSEGRGEKEGRGGGGGGRLGGEGQRGRTRKENSHEQQPPADTHGAEDLSAFKLLVCSGKLLSPIERFLFSLCTVVFVF